MSFLRPFSFADALPPLIGEHIELRAPEMRDYDAWAELREKSRDFLTPWEPLWPANDLTRSSYRARLRRYGRDVRMDAAYPYFIFRRADDALIGGVTLGQVRRGVAQATLSPWRLVNTGVEFTLLAVMPLPVVSAITTAASAPASQSSAAARL